MILLSARGLAKSYLTAPGLGRTLSGLFQSGLRQPPKIEVLRSLSFELNAGECIGIAGANGSGKSTLLRCLAGNVTPDAGTVERPERLVALLAHGFGAYDDLPAHRNLLLAQQLLGLTRAEAERNLQAHAQAAGLADRLAGSAHQLSEGMRARIALSALEFVPFQVLLLDEGLNHVDQEYRERFFLLTREWMKQGKGIVLTSHDHSLLERFCTRIIRLPC